MTENAVNSQQAIDSFYGLGVIRHGDNVFLINNTPSLFSQFRTDIKRDMELRLLADDDYLCPFDFIEEFEQWYEWRWRLYCEKQSTGKIITDMLTDVKRIRAHKIERMIGFKALSNFGFRIESPKLVIKNTTA